MRSEGCSVCVCVCVCACVCVSVCLSVSLHSNLRTGASRRQTESSSGTNGLHALISKGVFPKNAGLGN